MTHQSRALIAIGLAASLMLSGCSSFSTHSRNVVVKKDEWITHCFGRYVIDLPPDAVVRPSYKLWGIQLESLKGPASALDDVINVRERELKAQPHLKSGGTMFVRRVALSPTSTGLYSWYVDFSDEAYLLDTYAVAEPAGRVFRLKVPISPDREERAMQRAKTWTSNLRSREPLEIPTDPGFCIDGGFIAGSAFQVESFRIGVTFPNHPGAQFLFRSSTGAEENRLLERMGGFLMGVAKLVAGMTTLRKGERNVGPIQAEEYATAGSQEGQRLYSFTWESQGKDDSITEPNLAAQLGVLERNRDNQGNPPPPAFASDAEAVALWDAIVESIRLRPGAAGASSSQGNASTGMTAASGTPCPWPGIWKCDGAAQEPEQTFMHGQILPLVDGRVVPWRLVKAF
ncbi:MAG: T6SS immunity protein Tli4 family protein [Achromobacter sp.]|uniref:T6SS immunity protein Tli4 family protein n=1 Tax=Achromobacter sp. TaxID=134375 RepID=UPI0029B5265C|nr:T6SS immunity protein Tli4 family protein [Achromobacter sp.]MDX3988929.1 T6SS immunity protein Tli4 family protein [Achromobacter sp.]